MKLRLSLLVLASVLSACGGGNVEAEAAEAPAATSGDEAGQVSQDAHAELAAQPDPQVSPTAVAEPRQGDLIEAGQITRAELNAVLGAGIPRFLQQVRTEPQRDGNRFIGWRLLSIFDDPRFAEGPLRIGDIVLGVNGRTIERPEQFFSVWESMSAAVELRLQLLRAGQAYEVRYAIVD